jgi:hypothetical protein
MTEMTDKPEQVRAPADVVRGPVEENESFATSLAANKKPSAFSMPILRVTV